MAAESSDAAHVEMRLWNQVSVLVLLIGAGWIFAATQDAVLWFVVVPWLLAVAWLVPITMALHENSLDVTYVLHRRRLAFDEIRSLRIRRYDGMARLAKRRGVSLGCDMWSPGKIDAFAEELERRGVKVQRRVLMLVDWT